MSVLIQGMRMPGRCNECPMRQINLARCQVTGKSTSHHPTGKRMLPGVRPSWCPLAEASQEWIPVAEKLPEPGTHVLISRPKNGKTIVEQAEKDAGDWWRIYGTRVKKVDAWMPLPESYEED